MSENTSRFEEAGHYWGGCGDVYEISESGFTLHGGGDFYDGDRSQIDPEVVSKAYELAKKYGMRITSMCGAWEGWSEYTPDPGSVSRFEWEPA